jgi:hypothetical protein
MTRPSGFTNRAARGMAGAVVAAMFAASSAEAQVCHGTPPGSSIAYVNGAHRGGTSHGGAATFTPGSSAITLAGNVSETGSAISGFEGSIRYSLVRGSKVVICPTLALGFERTTWDLDATTTLNTNEATGRAGLGAGYAFAIGDKAGIAPFLMAEYAHRLTHFDLQEGDAEAVNTGVDKGRAEASFGLVAYYTRVYLGASVVRTFESGPALQRRLYVGFSF